MNHLEGREIPSDIVLHSSKIDSSNHVDIGVTDKVNVTSVNGITEYFPFSSEQIHDTTQKEDDDIENQLIPTVTGNRIYPWSDNSNLIQLYGQTQGWEEDSSLPEGWNDGSEGWS